MKGLILAAGLGTRLRPITSLRPKPTIAVANKPLIHYAVDNLVEAGIREIGVVVSHDTITQLQQVLADYSGADFSFIIQDPPKGLAHAVQVSRDFLGDDAFVMYLGDNLFEHGIGSFVEALRPGQGVNAVLALVPVEDPRQLGVAVVEGDRITRLVEKPSTPPSNLAIAGVYVFDAHIHEMIEGLTPGAKGEYQITDAVQRLIESGYRVASVQVRGWWKDTGKPEDILDANRLLLLRLTRDLRGHVSNSTLTGEVVVAEGATISGSTVMGPALIGAGATVENAYVGPFTTLGDHVTIRDAEVEYAVVGVGSRIEAVRSRIHGSLIGEEVMVRGNGGRPTSHRLIIGDKSVLMLHE